MKLRDTFRSTLIKFRNMTTIAQLNEQLFALVKTGTDVTQDYCQIFPQLSVDDIADEDKRIFVSYGVCRQNRKS